MKQCYLTILVCLMAAVGLNAQHVVKGTVIDGDSSNDALIGATVLEKGTTNGTTTDFDGKYELTVSSKDAVLEFTFIGYATQEIKIDGQSTVDI